MVALIGGVRLPLGSSFVLGLSRKKRSKLFGMGQVEAR